MYGAQGDRLSFRIAEQRSGIEVGRIGLTQSQQSKQRGQLLFLLTPLTLRESQPESTLCSLV
jgi:hypothetical protein